MPTRNSRIARRAGTALVAIAVAAALTVPTASAANRKTPAPILSVANGAVGVPQTVAVIAPGAAGTTVSVQIGVNGTVVTQQSVSLNAQGSGGFTWTPTSAGSWTFSGVAGQAPVTISVAAIPTRTTLYVPNQVQTGVTTVLKATVQAGGTYLPAGTVTFTNAATGEVLGVAPVGGTSTGIATGRVSWQPSSPAGYRVTATYISTGGGAVSSASTNTSTVLSTPQLISLLVPPTLTYGQPVTITTRLNSTLLEGGVATWVDANGSITNLPQGSGVIAQESSAAWTPATLGNQLVYSSFFPTNGSQTGSTVQWVSVQPAPAADPMSVTVGGRGPLTAGPAQPVPGGARLAVAGTSGSGAPVTFVASGSCYLVGATLITASSGGTCYLSASSVGAGAYGTNSAAFTLIAAKPAKR
jgi:hypothetical protein